MSVEFVADFMLMNLRRKQMFKKVKEDAILPTRGSKYSACVDVYANEDVTIGAGETKLIGLGIAIDVDNLLENVPMAKDMKRWFRKNFNNTNLKVSEDKSVAPIKDKFLKSHYLQLMLRSSLAAKGLMLGNGVGVIDLDFADEIKMIIHNSNKEESVSLYVHDLDCISSYSQGWNDALDKRDAITNKATVMSKQLQALKDTINTGAFLIKKGDRIGQLVLLEHKSYLFGIESEDERVGGFGSTDKKENNV